MHLPSKPPGNAPNPWLLPFAIIWASPWTLVGLAIGLIGCLSGGGVRRVGRAIEFHGGAVRWLLRKIPIGHGTGAAAMTMGHVILGQDTRWLDLCREHEFVHICQFERWGPFFVPAYCVAAIWLWLNRRNPYIDNPFEREAYTKARIGKQEDVS